MPIDCQSHGFHLLTQGADPIPSVPDAEPPYRLTLVKCAGRIEFLIDDLTVLGWSDDGRVGGPPLTGGRIGFRQMASLIAEYANLEIHGTSRLRFMVGARQVAR